LGCRLKGRCRAGEVVDQIWWIPIGSMVLLCMVAFTINIPKMLAYIPYMDPMGYGV
jgi:hypothetical protein